MDAAHVARVAFLAQPDAWAAWVALEPDEEKRGRTLDAALAEYGDLRLVAAYVLDVVAARATRKVAEDAAAAGEQVKRYKVDGEYEEEYFAPGPAGSAVDADLWTARARALRDAVQADLRQRLRGGSLSLGVGSAF